MTDVRASRLTVDGAELVVLSRALAAPRLRLTKAERDVAGLASEGLSNAEIAAQRGRTVRTVANQLASVFRKLAVESRHQIAAKLVE